MHWAFPTFTSLSGAFRGFETTPPWPFLILSTRGDSVYFIALLGEAVVLLLRGNGLSVQYDIFDGHSRVWRKFLAMNVRGRFHWAYLRLCTPCPRLDGFDVFLHARRVWSRLHCVFDPYSWGVDFSCQFFDVSTRSMASFSRFLFSPERCLLFRP